MSDVLTDSLRLYALGLSLFPLGHNSKRPDTRLLPKDEEGRPTWKPFQSERAPEDTIREWFGGNEQQNIGVALGRVSGVVVVDSDTSEAERWCAEHLPPTPMVTRTARGFHRYYQLPTSEGGPLPAFITVSDTLKIELRRDGQYVVGPGSVHPSGHVYTEVEPWPSTLDGVPEFPVGDLTRGASHASAAPATAEPLPGTVPDGERNNTLFREGCRLRRLGWNETEIVRALVVLNTERCRPPLDREEVERIGASCATYSPAQDTYPLTEAGDAEYFARCFGETVRYDHRRGRWLLFQDHRWAPQTDGELHRLALEAVRGRQAAAMTITGGNGRRTERLKWATGGEARSRLVNLLALAQNVRPIADAGDNWDTDPWLLGVENGVVDLRTGTLRAGQPDDRTTMRARTPFDPAATCPLWDQTISEIFDHDEELIAYFDRFTGYSLTGDCREEVLALCWGTGANGKGTLMNTMGWLLGDYADDLPFSALELHERSGIPNDIAKIVGKRFVTSSETAETRRLNEARVKALTGRDPITARFLHREFFTFQPNAKFWLATNQKPVVRDTSIGFWRRIHLIPFTQSFVDRPDLELKEKLQAEGAGILARAVRGCLSWRRDGLTPPSVVQEATDSYRTDSMPLARFLDARCVVQEGARARFGELFQAYTVWCRDAGERSPLTRRLFREALVERFPIDPDIKRHVTYVGIGLLDPSGDDEM